MAGLHAGSVVAITGAGSGIGAATARLLAKQGAHLHLADVDSARLQTVCDDILARGGKAKAYIVDVSDAAAVHQWAADVYDSAGRVDVLYNNAGIGHGGDVLNTTSKDWERVIGINLLGVAHGVQAFAPRMIQQPRLSGQRYRAQIISTASMAGLFPIAQMGPYVASKFGVIGLTQSLNAELKEHRIRVSAICPGVIATPIVERGIMRGDMEQIHERANDFYARFGTKPEVVAKAVLRTISRPRMVVPVPRYQVTVPYLAHRLSPRLTQSFTRWQPRVVRALGRDRNA